MSEATERKAEINGFCGYVVVTCHCGHGPVMVPFQSQVRPFMICSGCKSKFVVNEFHLKTDGTLNLNMGVELPKQIETPQIVLPHEFDQRRNGMSVVR